MSKTKLKVGDLVQAIAGKDKGKQGKVLKVIKEKNRILVEGINQVKRHARPNQKNPQGGIEEKNLPLHISNVMLVDPDKGKPTRVGIKVVAAKKAGEKAARSRIAKLSGKELS